MKVLILNHELSPIGGGAGRASHQIAAELVRLGHQVDCLTSNSNGSLPARETRDGYTIYRVPGFRKSAQDNRMLPTFACFLTLGFLKALVLARKNRYDVVHAFFAIPSGLLACWLKAVLGVPVVVSLRGSDVPGYDEGKVMVNRLSRVIARVWRRSDATVALSHGLLRLARETAPLANASVIHNGVNVAEFPARSLSRRKEGALRMLCVSRLETFKGIEILLAALGRLRQEKAPAFSLKILGDGSRRESLQAFAKAMDLEANVVFAGSVPPDRMAGEYAGADILVHSALSEAFGQVLTEAMACGLPVLATRTGGIPEIVEDGVHGWLVAPGDAAAMAAALRSVLSMARDDLARIGSRNSVYVRERFDWSHVARAYEGVYRRVARPAGSV